MLAAVFGLLAMIAAFAGCSSDSPQPDVTPPAAVDDLMATLVTPDSTVLMWTATGDDGDIGAAISYRIKTDSAALTEESWDSTAVLVAQPFAGGNAGTVETLTLYNLEVGRQYLALRSRDEANNWSPVSNSVRIEVGAQDTIPPAAIANLGVVGEPSAFDVTLAWTAPGDDGTTGRAESYEIRQHTESFTEAEWDTVGTVVGTPPAGPPGTLEDFNVGGLEPKATYYFAIRTYDEIGNRSPISNLVPVITAAEDEIPPAEVTDLSVSLDGLDTIVVQWSASGDDGSLGFASAYDLRYANDPETLDAWTGATRLTTGAPRAPGDTETYRLEDLPRRTPYFFAVEVLDNAGNRSPRSAVATISTSDSVCVVRPDGTGDYPTIGDALALGGGCEIQLEDGTYQGEGNAVWPASSSPAIYSASGRPAACVIDFDGRNVSLPPAVRLNGITFEDAGTLVARAADSTGFVLDVSDCVFDGLRIAVSAPVDRGPAATFRNCEFRDCVAGPVLNLGIVDLQDCSFHDNAATLVVAYDLNVQRCTFEENSIGTGALLRSFNDLTGPNRFLVEDCRFLDTQGVVLSPLNGLLEIRGSLFAGGNGSCVVLEGSAAQARISESTFVRNFASSGSVVRAQSPGTTVDIERSILVGNGGGQLLSLNSSPTVSVACTDIFGNALGNWIGVLSGLGTTMNNLELDPDFCDWTGGDYGLQKSSPCAAAQQPECGRIGAFDAVCP